MYALRNNRELTGLEVLHPGIHLRSVSQGMSSYHVLITNNEMRSSNHFYHGKAIVMKS
jgi:hypothetical protein